jgi:thiol-disulfide isomerase/thioredoxin
MWYFGVFIGALQAELVKGLASAGLVPRNLAQEADPMALCRTASALRCCTALTVLCLLALCSPGCDQGGSATSPGSTTATSGQTASEVLAQMVSAYRETDRYSDRANYILQRVKRTEGVKRENLLFELSLASARPNKIRFHYQRMYPSSQKKVKFDLASDGELVRTLAGQLPGQIHEAVAPELLTAENFIPDPFMRDMVLQVPVENIYPQLSLLLATGDDASLFANDGKPRLLEPEQLHGRQCHRVSFESTNGTRVLWIDVETHALRRMKLPTEGQLATLDPQDKYSHYAVWIDYLEPTLDAKADAVEFALTVPEGARRVREFVLPPPPGPLEILGQPVTSFSFTTLEGEEVTPATLAGNLVVMEFWSKTCPPCRQHTPLLDQVYRELKETEDFLFFAVNANLADTSNETVAQLFKSWGGSIPLLRDLQETSYTKLGINMYPHTIIVGRDGRLQLYRPGMHASPEPLLATVRQLLAGEDLAAAAHAEHAKLVEKYEQQLEAATIKAALHQESTLL